MKSSARSASTRLGAIALAAGLAGALTRCGGNVVVDPTASTDAGPMCAAATAACDLPGQATSDDACSACVNQALCACQDNPKTNWLSHDCDITGETCSVHDDPPQTHACQVVAVGMVKCMLHEPHEACQAAYFAQSQSPEADDPLGMEFNLFGCAVCSACAGPCAALSPDFGSVCCATNPSSSGTCK